MLQRLEGSDRRAELLAGLQVVDGELQHLVHGADRLPRAAIASSTTRSTSGKASSDFRRRSPAYADTFERNLRGASAVLGRITAPGEAARSGIHQEEADPAAVAPRAAVRAVTRIASACRRGGPRSFARRARVRAGRRHVVETSSATLGVGEGQQGFARGDARKMRGLLVRAAAVAEKAAAEDHRLEVGFERERAAEGLHDDHDLDRPAAEPAVLLRERDREQSEFGVDQSARLQPSGSLA